jgi:MerR family transcriptional regulator, repressor of the yfmOP operon
MTDANAPELYLQIGEAADRLGLTQRTLRYYEEKGLLKPPSRMDGGFRLYSPEDLERVERIKQLKELLGFSLADIRDLMDAEDIRHQIRAEWRKDADAHQKAEQMRKAREATLHQIRILDQKMAQMSEMRDELVGKLEKYDAWFRDHALVAETAASAG